MADLASTCRASEGDFLNQRVFTQFFANCWCVGTGRGDNI